MIITDRQGQRKRKLGYEVIRKRGTNNFFLMLTINSRTQPPHPLNQYGRWNILSGGKLAMTGPSWRDCYSVPWSKLPDCMRNEVLTAIEYIEEHGTPMQNDESVF